MPTREAVEHLKNNWLADPCYDLENVEGFEEHRDELLAYRLGWEATWKQEYLDYLARYAEHLGIPGDIAAAANIERDKATRKTLAEKAAGLLLHYLPEHTRDNPDAQADIRQIVTYLLNAMDASVDAKITLALAMLDQEEP